jgi:uncharacterized protein (TIGR02145 family)
MSQNMNVGTRINGTIVQTDNGIIEKYCYNNSESNCDSYGALYQWGEAVQYLNGASNSTSWDPVPTGNVQGICPAGWHFASDADWSVLTSYLGESDAATKMKSTSGWYNNGNGTNSSGFTGLPCGTMDGDGTFWNLTYLGDYWTSSQYNSSYGWYRILHYNIAGVVRNNYFKNIGRAVRCIMD